MNNNDVIINLILKGGDSVKNGLAKATGDVNRFGKTSGVISKSFGLIKTGAIAAGAAAVAGMGAIIKTGIEVASSLETTEAGFKTLLGSTKKARNAMNMIKRDAINTPFDTLGLARLNQQLTGVTKNAKRSQKIILDVGEAVIGMGRGTEELDRIIVNLQQIGATGRASMIDIRQFAFAGIPIFDMLKKETGLSGEALDKFVSDGKVSFEMIEKMFDKANNKGGLFFEAYKNNANTFAQKSAALKESWQNFTASFVKETGLMDTAKGVVEELTKEISAKGGLTDALKVTFKLMKSEDAINVMKTGIKGLTAIVKGLTASIVTVSAALGNANSIKQTYEGMTKKEKESVKKNIEVTKDLYTNQGRKVLPPTVSKKQKKRSQIKSVIPSPSNLFRGFDSGGIVGGNSYFGDKKNIRVSSGEMILNRSQQTALFNMLKGLSSRPNINFNGGVNFGSNSSPMQQENNFVNMLMQLQ